MSKIAAGPVVPPLSSSGRPKPASLVVVASQFPTCFFGPDEWNALSSRTRPLHGGAVSAEEALADVERLSQVEILFNGWSGIILDSGTLALMPKLRAVFFLGGSVRWCVSEAFWARSIPIVTAASANARPVVEYTVAALVFGLKGFIAQAQDIQQGRPWRNGWDRPGCFRTTVGLVSFGAIARGVRELLASFDLEVIVYDPFVSDEVALQNRMEKVETLDELFSRSHAVSLHTPLLPETTGLIRREHLLRLPQNATFINSSRGAVVDEAGLIEALRERPDIQALIDVVTVEPLALENPLCALPNAFITPHVAGSTGTECRRMTHLLFAELDAFLAGNPLRFAVRESELATMA